MEGWRQRRLGSNGRNHKEERTNRLDSDRPSHGRHLPIYLRNGITQGRGPALPLKLKDAADALLYLGPPTSLQTVPMPQSELAGTAYGNEIERRIKLQMALEN